MRFVLEGFVVEIRAKKVSNGENARFTKEQTMDFCNTMSIAFDEASRWNEEKGYDACAYSFKASGNEIYDKLSKHGYYDDVRK